MTSIRETVHRIRQKPISEDDKVALLVATIIGITAQDARRLLG